MSHELQVSVGDGSPILLFIYIIRSQIDILLFMHIINIENIQTPTQIFVNKTI